MYVDWSGVSGAEERTHWLRPLTANQIAGGTKFFPNNSVDVKVVSMVLFMSIITAF